MKLFWTPKTRSMRAIWMLEEAGIEYDMEQVDIGSEERKHIKEFLRASPMGKVPALIDGDAAMSESAAICLYIADRYRSGELAPAIDDPQRGRFLYWLMYTPAVVEPAMIEKVSNVESNRVRNGWRDFDTMISTFEDALSDNTWVLGAKFSAADVMLGSSAHFLRLFKMLPEASIIADYAERCVAREAFQRALAVSGD